MSLLGMSHGFQFDDEDNYRQVSYYYEGRLITKLQNDAMSLILKIPKSEIYVMLEIYFGTLCENL